MTPCAPCCVTSRVRAGPPRVRPDLLRPRHSPTDTPALTRFWRRSRRAPRLRLPVRWADLDLLGHVNNVTYVDYLQEARVDMLRTQSPDTRADDLAEGVVVVRHEVTYVAPLTFRLRPV